MSGVRRFFLDSLEGVALELEGDEAHHARNVIRVQEGQAVTLFDGRGSERTAVVKNLGRHTIGLEPSGDVVTVDRRPDRHLHVAVAYPKSRARGLLTEKLVELGVRSITPLTTRRGISPPDPNRLAREALAACKQCGINHLPVFHPAASLEDLKASPPAPLVVLDPDGQDPPPDGELCLVVGPEGGLAEDEIRQLAAPCWSLGSSVLRVETACLAAIARLTG